MTIIDPAPPITDLPSGSNATNASNNIIEQVLVKIGLAPAPPSGTPSAPPPAPKVNWPAVQAQLLTDWPGYAWPSTYNAELVATLFSDVLGRLGREAQYSWEVGLGLQLELNLLYHYIVVLETNVSALSAGPGSVAAIPGLTGDLASLESQIVGVANQANALTALLGATANNLQANINQVNNGALIGLQALTQALGVAAGNLQANINAVYDSSVAGDTALTQALGTAAANLQANINAVHDTLTTQIAATSTVLSQQVTNETARATGVENAIINAVVPAAVAGLATQVETQLAPIRTAVQTCLEPLCDTVTPNAKQLGGLGSLLKGLEGLGIAGLLAGLVAAAIAEPEPAATAIVDATGWVVDLSVELVDAV